MSKLFKLNIATEDDKDGELLIDKVITAADKNKEGLRVTADLIKQRESLRTEITKELGEKAKSDGDESESDSTKDESGEDGDASDGGNDDAGDPPADEETGDDSGGEKKDDESDDTSDEKGDGDSSEEKKDDEEDDVETAQTSDGVEGLIGSGLKKDSPAPKEEKKTEDKEEKDDKEVTKESYTLGKTVRPSLFNGVLNKHLSYCMAMEGYNLSDKAGKPTNQPVAYVKEEVVSSLKKLVALANTYVAKNERQVELGKKSLAALVESLMVYDVCQKEGKLHLTLKTISDENKFKSICSPGTSSLKETSKDLLGFLDSTTTVSAMILENDLKDLKGGLSAGKYKEEADAYCYENVLPGFNSVHVSVAEYRDYLHTKYDDYQFYRVAKFKPQDLYDLKPISLYKDEEVKTVFDNLTNVTIRTALLLDNIASLSTQYGDLVEKVKSTCFDIEQDKVKSLPDLDIDSRLKDFVRFKLVSELLNTAVDISIEYVTSVIDSFSVLIELDN